MSEVDIVRQFKREDRLNQQILRDVSHLLERELSETFSGITTFTAVRLTRDLRIARVYYSYWGDNEERNRIEAFFHLHKGRIRKAVGSNLRIRHIPDLLFIYDPSIERGMRIEQLLNELKGTTDQDE